jgi:hypothetical protein
MQHQLLAANQCMLAILEATSAVWAFTVLLLHGVT